MAGLKRVRNCLKSRPGTPLAFRGSLAAALVKPAFGSQHDLHFTRTVLVSFRPPLVDTRSASNKLLQTTLLRVVYFLP